MKVIVFGTGMKYQKMRHMFQNMQIQAIVDSNSKKQGTWLDGYLIDSPKNVSKYDYDFIILVGKYYQQMREQLLDNGISADKILDEEHKGIFDGIITIFSYAPERALEKKKKIALVSHDMSLTGAPVVLLTMAEVLKKNGYIVDVISEKEGKLTFSLIEKGIGVIQYQSLNLSPSQMREVFDKYDYIVANTVTIYSFVKKVSLLDKPILWWLHEEDDVYEQYKITAKELFMPKNVHIFGVGNRARQSYKKYSEGCCIPELLYGVEECAVLPKYEKREKLIFALIGSVCYRKGEDIWHQAIRNKWEIWKEKAEFWMIGTIPDALRAEYEKEKMIKIFGSVEHEEVLKLLSKIDVVVCPSRNDPMPVVLTEGMMLKKVCIASDMTGTSEKIVPYENGLICQAGNIGSLQDQMQWVMEHVDKCDSIGQCAYETYKREFSINKFETRILKIINHINMGGRES